jgi:hypothetical protein
MQEETFRHNKFYVRHCELFKYCKNIGCKTILINQLEINNGFCEKCIEILGKNKHLDKNIHIQQNLRGWDK